MGEVGYAMAADTSSPEQQVNKKKKMNFIKRWIAKVSREAWEEARNQPVPREDIVSAKQARLTISGSHPSNIDQPERAIQFTIYNASGGRVVETRRYDRQKDRHTNGLYVITNDQDFGREIDKIITMEALK